MYPATSQALLHNGGGNYTLIAQWDPGLPDEACYDIDLSGNIPGLTGDTDCLVRGLVGDTNGDRSTSLIDYAMLKQRNGQSPLAIGARFDVNTDGRINLIDFALTKGLNGNSAFCP